MLNSISSVLKRKGPAYLNKLLDSVVITEKLDTYRILFENINGKIKFFKKDNIELNLTERVITNIWEDAIIELSILLSEHKIPENLCFGISYTPINKPIRLEYNNIPKYILTDITKRHSTTKKVVESYEYEDISVWAKKLNIGLPPIIFDGKLSDDQKKKLIEYDAGNYLDLGDSLQSILPNGSYSKSEIIEGIIIKNGDQLMQIETYEFKILNESYQNMTNTRDFYDLTLLRINAFMETYIYPNIISETVDYKYVELICDIFNKYYKSGNISEDIDPSYLNPPSYGYAGNLNPLLLSNLDTIKILEKGNKIHESVFKIMLSSFRKYKKPYGLLNESDVQKFNTHVFFVNEKIGGSLLNNAIPDIELLYENKIYESISDNNIIKTIGDKVRTDIDNMQIISSVQKAFSPIAPKINKGEKKCIIYLTDPQPFNISHQENIEKLYNTWKLPIILCFVNGSNRVSGEKFHFSDSLKKAQIEAFAINSQGISPAFFSISSWSISEIFQHARPKYEPIAIITDFYKKSDLALQLYLEEKIMGGRLGVDPEFNIGEMEIKDTLLAFRSIEDNISATFKILTPSPIWGLFNLMVSEYKSWNGSVPTQFI